MIRSRVALAVALSAQAVLANPEGASIVAGGVTINAAGNVMTIQQTDNRGIIHWQSFSNTAGEAVRFQQPAGGATLNRVTGPSSSQIAGELSATGQVWLMNPNGIVFTPTAQVNVGGLVATTLHQSDDRFLYQREERKPLVQDSTKPLAAVVNQGHIQTTAGGLILFAAPVVSNQGTLRAPGGEVVLAAGTEMEFDGSTTPNHRVLFNHASARGNVVLPDGSVDDALSQVVNDGNLVQAGSVQVVGGTVTLVGAEGVAVNSGAIDVSSAGRGGKVVVRSSQVTQLAASSRVDGSSSTERGADIYVLSVGRADVAPGSRTRSGGGVIAVRGGAGTRVRGQLDAQGGPENNGGVFLNAAYNDALYEPERDFHIVDKSVEPGFDEVSEALLESLGTTIWIQGRSVVLDSLSDGVLSLKPGQWLALQGDSGGVNFANPANTIDGGADSYVQLMSYFGPIAVGNITATRITVGAGLDGEPAGVTFGTLTSVPGSRVQQSVGSVAQGVIRGNAIVAPGGHVALEARRAAHPHGIELGSLEAETASVVAPFGGTIAIGDLRVGPQAAAPQSVAVAEPTPVDRIEMPASVEAASLPALPELPAQLDAGATLMSLKKRENAVDAEAAALVDVSTLEVMD